VELPPSLPDPPCPSWPPPEAGAELLVVDEVTELVLPAGAGLSLRVITNAMITAMTATAAPANAMSTAGCLYQGLGCSGSWSWYCWLYIVGSSGGSGYDMTGA
jgi:hypothetical protein